MRRGFESRSKHFLIKEISMIYPRTFYIETYGCTFNQADSAKITNLLLEFHYLPSSLFHAEFIIINTCAVKSQTE
ncbi:MAG: hypothetical protein ACTSRD_14300, partial [Promethearchaeota archaeon]